MRKFLIYRRFETLRLGGSADEQQRQQILSELNLRISTLAKNSVSHQLHR